VTASELAYLATGLLLGAAIGAAFLMVLGNRPHRREIRVTVTHGAVPGRSETLSEGAFVTARAEVARGGPGDRRMTDRDALPASAAIAERAAGRQIAAAESPGAQPPSDPLSAPGDRTIVPSRPSIGIEIHPEPDPALVAMRRRPPVGAPIERMLRGDLQALVEVVDRVAGADSRQRRTWEVLLGGLVEAFAEIAVRESVIDFPMGTAFWDSFTVEQCRRVVAALDSMGYRYDGRDGWREGRVPAYRDLTRALADIGLEPRRVRAWPSSSDIAQLFVGARPAPEELRPAAGPDDAAGDVRAVLGEHAAGLADLWLAWDLVRPILFEEKLESGGAAAAEVGAAYSAD
jgi:hypothetical protein